MALVDQINALNADTAPLSEETMASLYQQIMALPEDGDVWVYCHGLISFKAPHRGSLAKYFALAEGGRFANRVRNFVTSFSSEEEKAGARDVYRQRAHELFGTDFCGCR